jgi:hypothetical protein
LPNLEGKTAAKKGWAHLRWAKRDQRRDWMKRSEGCHLLRGNVTQPLMSGRDQSRIQKGGGSMPSARR